MCAGSCGAIQGANTANATKIDDQNQAGGSEGITAGRTPEIGADVAADGRCGNRRVASVAIVLLHQKPEPSTVRSKSGTSSNPQD